MSGTMIGETTRDESENGLEMGVESGGKRDSDASSGSEGSQRQSQAREQEQRQQRRTPGQGQNAETGAERTFPGSNQVKRHVEASPQGRYLRFEDKLGTGQYKVVYRSYDTWMGIEVAWNTVNIKNLPKEEKKRIMNEVRLLQNLEHKNLVQFHGSWVNRDKEEVIVVTEIMQSGSLMDFIRKVEIIRWRVVKRWARQILRGMDYLHSQDPPIIHRDLKCDNIFINGAAGDIRIGDLGLSTSSTRSQKTMSVLGTPEFMAPELYEESYNEKVDVYAFGMCMLEMVTKERPYSECVNAAQIYRKVTSQILPSALDRVANTNARRFIRECLNPDPKDRPSAKELIDHEFLKQNEDEDDSMVEMVDPGSADQAEAKDTAVQGESGSATKIDPTLPGATHPAYRGVPGLDTIVETAAPGSNQGPSQGQPPPSAPLPVQANMPASSTVPCLNGGSGHATAAAVAISPQAFSATASGSVSSSVAGEGQANSFHNHASRTPAVALCAPGSGETKATSMSASQSGASALANTATPGHSGTSNSASNEPDGADDGRKERLSHKPSQVALSIPANGSDAVHSTRDSGADSGRETACSDRRTLDVSTQAGSAVKTNNDSAVVSPPELQHGVHKIPVNPPYESDDDDQQEHDANHPEGFLRSMPEDERSMRVLELPDGRVKRAEDDEEETSVQASGDEAEATAPAQTASSCAQALPVSPRSSHPPAEIAPSADVSGQTTAAPPTAAAPSAPGTSHANNEGATLLSRESSGNSSAVEANSVATATGSLTPGTVWPPGVPLSNMSNPVLLVSQQGGVADATPELAEKVSAVPPSVYTGSESGMGNLPAPSAGGSERAQSISPIDHGAEGLGTIAPPPIAPAPPRPGARMDAPEPQMRIHGTQLPESHVYGNPSGQAHGSNHERERQLSSPQADQEAPHPSLLASSGALGGSQTEIKVARLQGPEQEMMRLVMHTQVDGRMQEVEFDFNLDYDQPDQVSAEMVSELGLSDDELGQISVTIASLADKARRRRGRYGSSNGTACDPSPAPSQAWVGSEPNAPGDAHRGNQPQGFAAATPFGSGCGDVTNYCGSETAENDTSAAVQARESWSDDELDIEKDDEFLRRKQEQEKKKRLALNAYDARLAALLAAKNDRTDEHKRAQEKYRRECEDFEKRVEKLQSEKDRRMEECLDSIRGLEHGYRQKQRDAKQAKRQGAAAGNVPVQVGQIIGSGQPPAEQAPKPHGHPQHQGVQGVPHAQGQKHGQAPHDHAPMPHAHPQHQGVTHSQMHPQTQHDHTSKLHGHPPHQGVTHSQIHGQLSEPAPMPHPHSQHQSTPHAQIMAQGPPDQAPKPHGHPSHQGMTHGQILPQPPPDQAPKPHGHSSHQGMTHAQILPQPPPDQAPKPHGHPSHQGMTHAQILPQPPPDQAPMPHGLPSHQGMTHAQILAQPPPDQAPKPHGHAPHQGMSHAQIHGQNPGFDSSEGVKHGQMQSAPSLVEGSRTRAMGIDSGTFGEDFGNEQQLTTLSQHKSGEDVLRGVSSIWASNRTSAPDLAAVLMSAQQWQSQLMDDEERRDRFSTL